MSSKFQSFISIVSQVYQKLCVRNYWIFLMVRNQISSVRPPITQNFWKQTCESIEMKLWNLDDIARSTFFASALKPYLSQSYHFGIVYKTVL